MRVLVLLAALAFSLTASADNYTVQVASFDDYRHASSLMAQLDGLGYPTYAEFFIWEDRQWVRVRVGCFFEAAAAGNVAETLLAGITEEAVVMPVSDEANPEMCVQHDLGFRVPADWGVAASQESAVVFWTDLGGQRAFVAYDGNRWQPLQARDVQVNEGAVWLEAFDGSYRPLEGAAANGLAVSFESRPLGDGQVVLAHTLGAGGEARALESSPLVVAGGTLVWHSARAAVVLSGDSLIAVRILPLP